MRKETGSPLDEKFRIYSRGATSEGTRNLPAWVNLGQILVNGVPAQVESWCETCTVCRVLSVIEIFQHQLGEPGKWASLGSGFREILGGLTDSMNSGMNVIAAVVSSVRGYGVEGVSASTITLLVIFFMLAVGAVLVAYGTAAKNKWGLNFEPVSCSRCGTLLPRMRESRSLQQFLWGGWTCPNCGAGVDKWGREIEPNAPRTVVKPEAELRKLARRRFILATQFCFFLSLVLD